jgi:hypothetical protein
MKLVTGRFTTKPDDVPAVLEAVRLVEHIEQLRIGVLVLLSRVGIRRVHAVGDPVVYEPALCAVLGPRRNGIAEVLADDPFERLDVPRPVEASEQIVERSVLEEHQHHVVHRILTCWRHRLPPPAGRGTQLRCGATRTLSPASPALDRSA